MHETENKAEHKEQAENTESTTDSDWNDWCEVEDVQSQLSCLKVLLETTAAFYIDKPKEEFERFAGYNHHAIVSLTAIMSDMISRCNQSLELVIDTHIARVRKGQRKETVA